MNTNRLPLFLVQSWWMKLLGLKKQAILIKQTVLLKKVMDMRTAKRRAEKKEKTYRGS